MLQFENPLAFLFLLVIPLFFVLRKLKFFVHVSFPLTISDWEGKTFNAMQAGMKVARNLSRIFFIGAFCLVVTALASPVISRQEKVYTSRGTEIVFVVDISPSMAATDIAEETRLSVAKQAIASITDKMDGASFGLVAMATDAASVVPPTMDHEFFLSQLNSLSIGTLGEGTAIGTGLSTAVYHLASSEAPKKILVLLTDGDNNAGIVHPKTAAKLAKENGITLYVVGIGTKGTVPIEHVDVETGKRYSGFLDSSFDENFLSELASVSGGKYFSAENIYSLQSALEFATVKENVVQSFYYKSSSKEFYKSVLDLALLLFALSWIIRRFYMKELF
jgi:Ca-activated chloride channel family protein